jgi:hypothetical protein
MSGFMKFSIPLILFSLLQSSDVVGHVLLLTPLTGFFKLFLEVASPIA